MAVNSLVLNPAPPDVMRVATMQMPLLVESAQQLSELPQLRSPFLEQPLSLNEGFLSRGCQPAELVGAGKFEARQSIGGNYESEAIVQPGSQEALWQDLFARPSDWWDNRQEKRSPRHPDFRHKRSKRALWLDNRSKPAWVDSRLAASDTLVSVGSRGHPGTTSTSSSIVHCGARRLQVHEVDSEFETWRKQCDIKELSEAVEGLELLVQRRSHIQNSVFYHVLKRCTDEKDLSLGMRVHAVIVKNGYESDTFLANHIIRMYASHGRMEEAMQVFTSVPAPDTYMWTSMMSAYVEHGQPTHAISLYRQMHQSTRKPNSYVFVAVLRACAASADLATGKKVHDDVMNSGADHDDVFIGSCLVDMYAKCGSLEDARRVFDDMPTKNVVTWTAMIGGYVQQGLGQEALSLYADMQRGGMTPADAVTFVCLLQACSSVPDLHNGKKLHAQIQERGLEADLVVSNCLVDMYAKCGSLEDARNVFDRLPSRDAVTWNAMITGYAQHGLGQEALALYATMQQEGLTAPDNVTFVSLLKACACITALHDGESLHVHIREKGLESDVSVASGLVDMYSKCGSLENARKVFDKVQRRNVVTWNAMIAGYAQHGLGHEALALYASMQLEGLTQPNHVTYVCLLKACTSVGALHQGKLLHAEIQEKDLEADIVVGNSLVDMYARCGSMADARNVFNKLPRRDVVTWTAMIQGYVEQGSVQEALSLYSCMQPDCITPANSVTFVCLLQACANAGAVQQGKQIHEQIRERGLETDVVVGNCLVDMYGKFGRVEEARTLFDRLPVKDVVTWTAMVNAYAEHGEGESAIQCFEAMRQQDVKPNGATFTCLLVACSHEGLVKEGQGYFKMMMEDYGMEPAVKHYSCMVDLLARSGNLDEAEDILRTMPFQNDVVGWRALLSACKSHGDMERGRRCFDRLIVLEPENAAPYVLLGSMYASAGMWKHVDETEILRKSAGAWKKPAKACIEVEHKVHQFVVGEGRSDISSKLRSMTSQAKDEGHMPQTELVLKAMSTTDKEDALCGHAEKLALAYGLLNTPDGTPLMVTKNLRMCNDCHSSTKVMSRLEKRQIVVRDAHRVHCFLDGNCSCKDRK